MKKTSGYIIVPINKLQWIETNKKCMTQKSFFLLKEQFIQFLLKL